MGDGGEKFGQRVVILQAPAIYGFWNLPDLECARVRSMTSLADTITETHRDFISSHLLYTFSVLRIPQIAFHISTRVCP